MGSRGVNIVLRSLEDLLSKNLTTLRIAEQSENILYEGADNNNPHTIRSYLWESKVRIRLLLEHLQPVYEGLNYLAQMKGLQEYNFMILDYNWGRASIISTLPTIPDRERFLKKEVMKLTE